MIQDGKLKSLKKVILRYRLKSGLTDSTVPKMTIHGSKSTSNVTLAYNVSVHNQSGDYTSDSILVEADGIYKIWFDFENFENFIRFTGIDIVYGQSLMVPFDTTVIEPADPVIPPIEVTTNYMYVAAGAGEVWILRTDIDEWTQKETTDTFSNNTAIDFIDINDGIVIADDNYPYKTVDGAETYVQGSKVWADGLLESVQMISSSIGLAIVLNGSADGIYRTTNNGGTWTRIQAGTFYSLEMLNIDHGLATSYQNILTTNDGGLTWT